MSLNCINAYYGGRENHEKNKQPPQLKFNKDVREQLTNFQVIKGIATADRFKNYVQGDK
jgi:hypothetical protein